ncbi:MAG: hydrogenase expression protein HypE [Acidimicrobiales bacterium]
MKSLAHMGRKEFDVFSPVAHRTASTSYWDDPLALGPLRKVYMIWLAGASCEGCTVAATGGTHPRIEQLLSGTIPGLPKVELIHSLLSIESGTAWTENLFMAERGELDAPYIITWEGSVLDESTAGAGFWFGLGEDPATGRQITSREWLDRLVGGAAAVIAIGTCAAWGGIPAASGNVTGATGLGEHLGAGYRSAAGVPVVNIPGCAPLGDNYTETAAALLLHLNGLAPLPELDDAGRPAWLFTETVHSSCPRAGYYDEGVFAAEAGTETCLVELGCWGPIVQCNVAERGVIDGNGGCMAVGGICIGCTMPGFPDRFSPFFERPDLTAGAAVAEVTQPVAGGFLRRMRMVRGRHRRGDEAVPAADGRPRMQADRTEPADRFYRTAAPARSSGDTTPVAPGRPHVFHRRR